MSSYLKIALPYLIVLSDSGCTFDLYRCIIRKGPSEIIKCFCEIATNLVSEVFSIPGIKSSQQRYLKKFSKKTNFKNKRRYLIRIATSQRSKYILWTKIISETLPILKNVVRGKTAESD